MSELRNVREDELRDMYELDQQYVGHDESFEKFKKRFEEIPKSFVVFVENNELIAGATGKMEGEAMGIESIWVKEKYWGDGIGSKVLELFEEKVQTYADRISVASADNVKGFYRSNGYNPEKILLQVNKEELPENYSENEKIKEEKDIDSETKFLYASFEDYSKELRDRLKDKFNAFEVNTIFEKEI